MTVGEVIRTPEERAMGLLFKLGHSLTSRDAVERGGATLVGTGTTFGPDGMTLNGSGNLSYAVAGSSILRSTLTFEIEFTITALGKSQEFFSIATALGAVLCRIGLGVSDALTVTMGGTAVLSVAYATWSSYYNSGARNTIVVSTTTGATTMWLNGTSVGTSVTAWTPSYTTTLVAIGATYANGTRFVGTIHSLEIYGNVSTAVDEPYLRQGTLISKLDDYLVAIPGTSYYKRDSDGLYVTDVLGKAGITQALMGSDGATAAQFPSFSRPRVMNFDGGDQIVVGDSDLFSFTDGVNDLPFSVAALVRQEVDCVSRSIINKATSATVGEWQLATIASAGKFTPALIITDNAAGARIGRYSGSYPYKFMDHVFIGTYSGSKTAAGIRVYADDERIDNTDYNSGVYTGMQNTATPVRIGFAAFANAWRGLGILPMIFAFEISPLQARALSARLLRQSRIS